MRPTLLGLSLLLTFAAGCVAGTKSGAVPEARAGHEVIEQRWAYFCFEEGSAEQVNYKANAAGARGWEMVAAAPSAQGTSIWCFRQPRP
jgi:hypothetical protein